MPNLVQQHCGRHSGQHVLASPQVREYLTQLQRTWEVVGLNKKIRHEFTFADFNEAMFFVNEVAAIAEGEGHHPDIHIHFRQVLIELWTHTTGGLTRNDFILASKIEACDC